MNFNFHNKECAESLRTTLRSGVMNLKDRFAIRLDNDMRKGTIQFDTWSMAAKVSQLDIIGIYYDVFFFFLN